MDWASIAEISVAVGTWALAGFTLWLVKGQLSIAKEQREIQLYLELRKEFDGHLLSARETLANQLLDEKPHDDINETVMNFFEDMGMLVRRGYLDREMIWDTFGYFARMWWSACRDYVAKERGDLGDLDNIFFSDFEYLVERIAEQDVKKRRKTRSELEPSPSAIKAFLETEAQRPAGSVKAA